MVYPCYRRIERAEPTKFYPYEGAEYFSVDFTELWNPNKGKAGSLLTHEQRAFMEQCVVPLRHSIRHNNARLLPRRSIRYSGTPADRQIAISLEWSAKSANALTLPLNQCHDLFATVSATVTAGLRMAAQSNEPGQA